MPNKEILSDIKKIALYTLAGIIVMLGVFAALGHFSVGALLGGLLGGFTAMLNLFLLALTIEKSVGKGGKGAQSLMGISYIVRILIIAAVVIFAIKNPVLNHIAAIIPLIFPQIIIKILYTKRTSSKEKKDER